MSYYATNKMLTPSKIKKYLKSPNYFYKRYVTEEIGEEFSPAFAIGAAVDCWLTEGKVVFDNKYICVGRRNIKNPPVGIVELNNTQWEEVTGLSEAVERTTAFKDLIGYNCQQTIATPITGNFTLLAGRPDWYKIVDNTCIIVDLKTAEKVEAIKHHWDCISYGYYFSQAVYQYILKQLHPEITRFISRHIVVGKERYVNPVKTFLLSQQMIDSIKETLPELIQEISTRDNFDKEDTKWEDQEEIGDQV